MVLMDKFTLLNRKLIFIHVFLLVEFFSDTETVLLVIQVISLRLVLTEETVSVHRWTI